MDGKEEIKLRLSVEEVVGDYLPLRRSGRNLKALSPFSNEKTASLMVSPDKQIWHDFSTQKGGDIFSFVMEMEGVDFKGALELLARRAGVELTQFSSGSGNAKIKERIISANELAVRYYHQTLSKNKTALSYVKNDRGYTEKIIREFLIGYAPTNGTVLVDFLRKKGYTDKEIRQSGLATSHGSLRDMFRGRVVLPLKDGQGRTIGFTGRIMDDGQPKYLNTAQTMVYDKSGHVYGLSLAKQAIRDDGYVVVVEGNLDVVAAHMAGTTNVVAVAGTAMTKRHLVQLSRLTTDIRLAFDSDDAGLRATMRAIPLAQDIGVSLSIVNLPAGKDPDDIIKESPASWKRVVSRSQYAVDWVIDQLQEKYDIKTVQGKKSFSDEVLVVVMKLADSVEQDHYLQDIAAKLKVSANSLREKLNKTPDTARRRIKVKPSEVTVDTKSSYQDLLLGMLLRYPELRESLSNVKAEYFYDNWRQKTAKYILGSSRKPILTTPQELQEFDTYVKIALFRTEELYGSWSSSDLIIEAIGLTRRLLIDYQKNQKQRISKEIAEAEVSGDSVERERLLNQINQIIKGDDSAGTR